MSGKAPAFQFYVKDWLSDPQLKMASHSTKGIWIDMLCFMWGAEVRGEISGAKCQIKKMVGADDADFDLFVTEASALCFCYIVTDDNNKITIRNRRMYAEQKDKDDNRLRQARYRERCKDNKKVTPPSSSASASASAKQKKKDLAEDDQKASSTAANIFYNFETHQWENIAEEKMAVWSRAYPAVNITACLNEMASWLESNPKNRKSDYPRFINNWLKKAQDRAPAQGGGGLW